MKVVRLAPPFAIQNETGHCCEFRPSQLWHPPELCFRKTDGIADTHRQIEDVLCEFRESFQSGAASSENDAGTGLPFVTGVSNFGSDEMNDFFGARLKNVA